MNTFLQKMKKNRLYYKNRIEAILREFPFSDAKVLDLGCGEMLLYNYVIARHATYTGVDQLPFENREHFISCDILDYDFKGTPFDIIFLVGVLDHMPYREKELVLEHVQDHFSKALVVSQHNPANFLFRMLYPRRKAIRMEEFYPSCSVRKLALLKYPFYQRVFRLHVKSLLSKYLATEYVYVITKETE